MNLDEFVDEITSEVKGKYKDSSHNVGWSVLYSRIETLIKSEKNIIFLGLNPGGSDGGGVELFSAASNDGKSWYLSDEWESGNLQGRIIKLFDDILNADINNVLSGNLVPFRSKDSNPLTHEDIDFGMKIWEKIIENYKKESNINANNSLNIIIMGNDVRDAFLNSTILKGKNYDYKWADACHAGWKVEFYKIEDVKVCKLAHLSYATIGHPKTQELEKEIKSFFNL